MPLLRPDLVRPGPRRESPWRVYVHVEVMATLAEPDRRFLASRSSVVLGHLVLRGTSPATKTTAGTNEGWVRTKLGGNGGSHFYLWWAKAGTKALRQLELPDRAILVRAVRHHDDHAAIEPDDFGEYVPLLLDSEGTPEGFESPWSEEQRAFARSEAPVRLMLGQAGGGKTQALWQAVALRGGERVLLATWSTALADETRAQLGGGADCVGLVPADTELRVMPFRQLLGHLIGWDVPYRSLAVMRREFSDAVARLALGKSQIGAWHDRRGALFAELRAQRAGAVPEAYWTAPPAETTAQWVARRTGELGAAAAKEAGVVWQKLRLDDPGRRGELFPELEAAHEALARLLDPAYVLPDILQGMDRLVLDEVQDLAQVELAVWVELARRTGGDPSRWPFLLVAGDEGQSVRPSGFSVGWFNTLLARRYLPRETFQAQLNLRCPAGIARVVDRARELYGRYVEKDQRPRKSVRAEAEYHAEARLLHLRVGPDEACAVLRDVADTPGTVVVSLGDEPPAWLVDDLVGVLRTPEEVKGLEMARVVLLEPGRELEALESAGGTVQERLQTRLRIDRLRVALSRATDLLAFLDVGSGRHGDLAATLLYGEERRDWREASLDTFRLAFADEGQGDPLDRIEQLVGQGTRELDEHPEASERALVEACEVLRHLVDVRELDGQRQRDLLARALGLGLRLLTRDDLADRTPVATEVTYLLGPADREDLTPVAKALTEEVSPGRMEARAVLRLLKALSELDRDRWPPGLFSALSDHRHHLLARLEEAAAHRELVGGLVHVRIGVALALDLPGGVARFGQLQETAFATLEQQGDWATAERLVAGMELPPPHLAARLAERRGDWRAAIRAFEEAGMIEEALSACRMAGDPREAIRLLAARGREPLPVLEGLMQVRNWLVAHASELTSGERTLLLDILGGTEVARSGFEARLTELERIHASYREGLARLEAEVDKTRRTRGKVQEEKERLVAERSRNLEVRRELEQRRERYEERLAALGHARPGGVDVWRERAELAELEVEDLERALRERETEFLRERAHLMARLATALGALESAAAAREAGELRSAEERASWIREREALERRVFELEAEGATLRRAVEQQESRPLPVAEPSEDSPAVQVTLRVPALSPAKSASHAARIAGAVMPPQASLPAPSARLEEAWRLQDGLTLNRAAALVGLDLQRLLERLAQVTDRLPYPDRPLTPEQFSLVCRTVDRALASVPKVGSAQALSPLGLGDLPATLGKSRQLEQIVSSLKVRQKQARPLVQKVLGRDPSWTRDVSVEDCVKVVAVLIGRTDPEAMELIRRRWG